MIKGKDLNLNKNDVSKKRKVSETEPENYAKSSDSENGENVDDESPDCEILLENNLENAECPSSSPSINSVLTDIFKKKEKIYERKFNVKWLSVPSYEPWLEKNKDVAFCRLCVSTIQNSVFHLDRHAKTLTHINKTREIESNASISEFSVNKFIKQNTSIDKAELKMVMFIAEHNLPFLLLDHLAKFIASCAPDSEIFKKIKMNRQKGTALIKNVIATENRDSIQADLKTIPYTLITDESTDIGL